MLIRKSLTRMGIVLCFIFVITSNNNAQDFSTDLITIDVEKVYKEPKRTMMLSKAVKKIEYVKLETSPDCLISTATTINVSADYIIIYNSRPERILLFNRAGEFLNEIGRKGNGPGEYSRMRRSSLEISLDQKFISIASMTNSSIHQYEIDGSFDKRIKGPAYVNEGLGYTGVNGK